MGNNYNKSFNFRNGVQVDNDNFVVNPNGLVGIGTSVPTEFLDVYGTAKFTGLVTATNLTVSGVSTFYGKTNVGAAITLSASNGEVSATKFYGSATGLTDIYAIAVDGWYIDSPNSGIFTSFKVGIGTTNPEYSLQVGQNPNNGIGFAVDKATGNVKTSGIITAIRFSGPGDEIININASSIASGTLNNARLPQNISVSGIITATTFFRGNLTGTATTASTLTGSPNITVTNVTSSNINNSGIITSANIISGISSIGVSTISTRLYAESIGVGTNSPASDIHIRRPSTSSLQLTSDNAEAIFTLGRSTTLTGGNGVLRFGNTSPLQRYSTTKSLDIINYDTGNINSYLQLGSAGINTGSFHWFYGQITPNTPLMSLTYDGNLGIGVTNPTEKLKVAGITSISGSLFVDQNVNILQTATILGNLNVSGTAVIGNLELSINETSGVSTFYNVNITNDVLLNNKLGIANTNPLYEIHIGDPSLDITNSVILTTSGIGIGTIALYDGCGICGLDIDALLGVVSIGSTLTPDLPENLRLQVKNGVAQFEDIKVSGVTTCIGGFVGNLTGTATTASTLTGSPNISVTNVTSSNINNSGITTSVGGFTSGIGITNPVKITVTGNVLTFTVAGVGVTSLILFWFRAIIDKNTFIMTKRIPIFPISYFKDNIDDNEDIKHLLIPKIIKNVQDLPIPDGWFTNKLLTSFSGEKPGHEIFFGEDRTYQSILEKRYAKCFDNFFDAKYKIMIDEIWYNCYVNGEYQEQHDHLSGPLTAIQFSCVHFLSFDKTRHKPIKFYDPLEQIRSLSIEFSSNNYKPNYCPDINEGDFIMFPSYLQHSVEPSTETPDYPRITIALNIKVLEYGDTRHVN